jgi:GNAT superfamily N-acetyltransferase
MSFQIEPLREEHLASAASLASQCFHDARAHVRPLPARYEEAGAVLPLLRDIALRAPGVVALRNGQPVGFLLGKVLGMFRGRRSIWSPEWANAALGADAKAIYQEMYSAIAGRWVANGCFTHLMTLLAHQREVINSLHWFGFGLMAVDAVRDLCPIQGTVSNVHVRRAGVEDVEQVALLSEALQRYMASSPIFLSFAEGRDRVYHKKWLEDPDNALWLAFHGTEAVACLALEPDNPGAADLVQDETSVSITRAFTKTRLRGSGIGQALLQRALEWARSSGYQSCAVDFEPENVIATRFWLKYFQPACLSLVRHVDDRVAWAHPDRAPEDMW